MSNAEMQQRQSHISHMFYFIRICARWCKHAVLKYVFSRFMHKSSSLVLFCFVLFCFANVSNNVLIELCYSWMNIVSCADIHALAEFCESSSNFPLICT